MILITGATGHFGTGVINSLLQTLPAEQIVALVRDTQKAQELATKGVIIRQGSYDDKTSLETATTGVDTILLVSGMDANRYEQHVNVIDAAKKSGVNRVVYTSVSLDDVEHSAIKGLMESHFQTEEYLKTSGLQYTILRNTLYTDVIPMYVGEQVLETGIFFPAAEAKTPFALRAEMAEAAANVLIQDSHDGKIYQVTGSDYYTFEDIANTLSELSGKDLNYMSPDTSIYTAELNKAGLPEHIIDLVAGFGTDIREGRFEILTDDLERLLGRKPKGLKDAFRTIYNF